MNPYKDLLNEQARNKESVLRQLTDVESCLVKQKLLEIYKDFAFFCEKNHLTFMLGGGSCLGAVRHQGYIPWDDDLDLIMPRPDYERLKGLLKSGALDEKYEYSFPNDEKDAPCCFLKLYLKGTRWVEIGNENSKYPIGLFLDVFILDGAPNYPCLQKLKGFVANSLRLISNMVMESSSRMTESQKAFYGNNSKLNFYIKARRALGWLLSIVPHRKWISWFDNFVCCDTSKRKHWAIPTGRKLYCGEILPASVYCPVSYGMFEGVKVPLPGKCDVYLKNLYGPNYMTPPPENKRERHFIVEMKL